MSAATNNGRRMKICLTKSQEYELTPVKLNLIDAELLQKMDQ